ncbi:hypothetical protein ANCCAN_03419 [Ancylostoma caninum]|uniref:Alpha-ketoglutarate-dependent dioxygenase AlkB-like domain-containing protein n=1 Tax=Ancylostoma caninum TaxID=29170 RepID=A0A368H556_ANCCA|nr:hypothetical protein ANCCAN_03419 [Ancylostoma caninum]
MINPERSEKIDHDIRKWRERNPDTATEGMARPEDLQAIEDGTKGLPAPERNSKQVLKTVYLENRTTQREAAYVSNTRDLFNNEDAVAAEDLMHIVKDDYRAERSSYLPDHNLFAPNVKSEPTERRLLHSIPVTAEDLLPTTFPPTEALAGTSSSNPAKRPRQDSWYSPVKEIPVMDLLPSTFADAFLSTTPPKTKKVDPDASLSPVRESGFRDAHDALNDNSLLAAALEQSPYKLPVTFPVFCNCSLFEPNISFFSRSSCIMDGREALSKFLVKNAPPSVYYIPNFITPEEEEVLMSCIANAPQPKWTVLLNRRLQMYGGVVGKKALIPADDIPLELSYLMKKIDDLQFFPATNHVLVNEYQPGQGIMPHTDGPAFYHVVSNVTMGSHALLDFYRPINPEGYSPSMYTIFILI